MTPFEVVIPASGLLALVLMLMCVPLTIDEWRDAQANKQIPTRLFRRRTDQHFTNFRRYVCVFFLCLSYSVSMFFISNHLFG